MKGASDGEVQRFWKEPEQEKARVFCVRQEAQSHGRGSEGEGQQTAEVWGPEMREEGCGGFVFTDTRRTVALCVSSSYFDLIYHRKARKQGDIYII